jgi:hypothetical protein
VLKVGQRTAHVLKISEVAGGKVREAIAVSLEGKTRVAVRERGVAKPGELSAVIAQILARAEETKTGLRVGPYLAELRPGLEKSAGAKARIEIRSSRRGYEIKVGSETAILPSKLDRNNVMIEENKLEIRSGEGSSVVIEVGREGVYLRVGRERIAVEAITTRGNELVISIGGQLVRIRVSKRILPELQKFLSRVSEIFRIRYSRPHVEIRHEVKPARLETPGEIAVRTEIGNTVTAVSKEAEKTIELEGVKFTVKRVGDFTEIESEPITIRSRAELQSLYRVVNDVFSRLHMVLGPRVRWTIETLPDSRVVVKIFVKTELEPGLDVLDDLLRLHPELLKIIRVARPLPKPTRVPEKTIGSIRTSSLLPVRESSQSVSPGPAGGTEVESELTNLETALKLLAIAVVLPYVAQLPLEVAVSLLTRLGIPLKLARAIVRDLKLGLLALPQRGESLAGIGRSPRAVIRL